MKKLAIASIFFLLFIGAGFAGEMKDDLRRIVSDNPDERVPVIIVFDDRPSFLETLALRFQGADVKDSYNIINGVSATVPARAAERIAGRASVAFMEPDYEVRLVLHESASQIDADDVWPNATGSGVNVAVIDTGIDNGNAYLNVVKEADFTGEGTDDLHGHGTHVAGIIGSRDSRYRGISHGSNLLDAKVLNRYGSGYVSDVLSGIDWAVSNGADVISMSLGAELSVCDGTDSLSRAVDNAVSKGVVAVVAAGNSGPDSGTINSPGCARNAITVGAVDDSAAVTSWSSRGPTSDGRTKPDVVAPGSSIYSTWIDGTFRPLSGTSMATPHVSGVAALVLEANPSLSPTEVKSVIMSAALDLGLDSNVQGSGRIDAYASYLIVAGSGNQTGETNETDEMNDTVEANETLDSPRGGPKKTPPGLEKRKSVLELLGLDFVLQKSEDAGRNEDNSTHEEPADGNETETPDEKPANETLPINENVPEKKEKKDETPSAPKDEPAQSNQETSKPAESPSQVRSSSDSPGKSGEARGRTGRFVMAFGKIFAKEFMP